jgi:N-acetylmuramoyl-L-alanine amidase
MKVILDAGHGGVINGVYQTPGKRSPIWGDGSQLFEGQFNRRVVIGIATHLNELGIEYHILVPGQHDVSLADRVKMANEYHRNNGGDTLLVSVHGNAGGGKGFEVYTYYGESRSDKYATEFTKAFSNEFPNMNLRCDFADGDSDKEANFFMLRKTAMPAVLTENFFMDTESDCKIMMSQGGVNQIIIYHVKAIQEIVKTYERS